MVRREVVPLDVDPTEEAGLDPIEQGDVGFAHDPSEAWFGEEADLAHVVDPHEKVRRVVVSLDSDYQEAAQQTDTDLMFVEDADVRLQSATQVTPGDTVRVSGDLDEVLEACRQAGISQKNDAKRTLSLSQWVRVLQVDPSDNSVQCAVPEAGNVWFPAVSLFKFVETTAGSSQATVDLPIVVPPESEKAPVDLPIVVPPPPPPLPHAVHRPNTQKVRAAATAAAAATALGLRSKEKLSRQPQPLLAPPPRMLEEAPPQPPPPAQASKVKWLYPAYQQGCNGCCDDKSCQDGTALHELPPPPPNPIQARLVTQAIQAHLAIDAQTIALKVQRLLENQILDLSLKLLDESEEVRQQLRMVAASGRPAADQGEEVRQQPRFAAAPGWRAADMQAEESPVSTMATKESAVSTMATKANYAMNAIKAMNARVAAKSEENSLRKHSKADQPSQENSLRKHSKADQPSQDPQSMHADDLQEYLDDILVQVQELKKGLDFDEVDTTQEDLSNKGQAPALWRVLVRQLNVRRRQDMNSEVVCRKFRGNQLRGWQVGDWVELANEEGFVVLTSPVSGAQCIEYCGEAEAVAPHIPRTKSPEECTDGAQSPGKHSPRSPTMSSRSPRPMTSLPSHVLENLSSGAPGTKRHACRMSYRSEQGGFGQEQSEEACSPRCQVPRKRNNIQEGREDDDERNDEQQVQYPSQEIPKTFRTALSKHASQATIDPTVSSRASVATSRKSMVRVSVNSAGHPTLMIDDDDRPPLLEEARTNPRGALRRVVHSRCFEAFSGVAVLATVIFVGFDTNYTANNPGQVHSSHDTIHLAVNIFFLLELWIRILVDGVSFFCNKDWRWNWLDVVLVTTSVVDLCLSSKRTRTGFAASAGRQLRGVRLLRILRTIRIFRSLRSIHELRKMLYAIMSSFRTLMCSMLILVFVMYFFAVLLCAGVADYRSRVPDNQLHEDLVPMYGAMPQTIYTLYVAVSNGRSWDAVMVPLEGMDRIFPIALLVYVSVVLFGVSNVVTSVFVESAVRTAQHYRDLIVDEKKQVQEIALTHIRVVFEAMDTDKSGTISMAELESIMQNPELKTYLDALGISGDDTIMFFRLLDSDGSGTVSMQEFFDGCLRLQGEAKCIDIHALIHTSKVVLARIQHFAEYVDDKFADLAAVGGVVTHEFTSRRYADSCAGLPD